MLLPLLFAVYAILASAKTVSYNFDVGWVTVSGTILRVTLGI
jgi:hypothetical protein